MKKILVIVMVVVTLISFATVPVSAFENPIISPYLNNGSRSTSSFSIASSGLCEASVTYYGLKDVFTQVTVTTYIEKKILSWLWTKIDIGVPNGEWVDTSTEINGTFVHQYQLKDTGTYRAVITIIFSGTGGDDDKIENKIVKTYS